MGGVPSLATGLLLVGSPSVAFGQVKDVAEPFDGFGTRLTAGDFDGDSFADLAIAAPEEGLFGADRNGVVHVLYGGPHSLSSADSQFWHQDSPGVKDAIEPLEVQRFGEALAAGDFDADGADDLAIGVPYETVSSFASAGVVHVLHGAVGVGLTADRDQLWAQDAPGIEEVAEEFDNFGLRLATGDFDGDGFADLVVSAVGEWVGVSGGGVVHVLYGSGTGLSASGSQLFHQDVGSVKEQLDDPQDEGFGNEQFGAALAVGDFDGDGIDDLAIGAPYEDNEPLPTGWNNAGAVHVLYGSVTGLTDLDNELWVQAKIPNPGVTPEDQAFSNHFGSTLVAGDFNADGLDDLVIDAPWHDEDGLDNLGVLHVVFGKAGKGLIGQHNQFWHEDVDGILGTAEEFEGGFGTPLSVGDFDGNGVEDLAWGRPNDEEVGLNSGGAVHVLSGVDGVGLTAADNQLWTRDSMGVDGVPRTFGYFGNSLAAADFDGDGRDDLAIGSSGDEVNGQEGAGSVHVLHGAETGGVTTTEDQVWNQNL